MKKIWKVTAACVVAACMASTPVFAAGSVTVRVDGFMKPMQTSPIMAEEGYVLVPLRELENLIGAVTTWNAQTKVGTITYEDNKMELQPWTTKALVNGNEITLSAEAKLQDDTLLVPLRFIGESMGIAVEWDDEDQMIVLETGKGGEEVSLLTKAEDDIPANATVLTYDQAVRNAVNNNSSLKQMLDAVEVMELTRDDTAKAIRLNYLPEVYVAADVPILVTTLRGLKALETSLASIDKQEEIIKTSLEMAVQGSLATIEGYKLDIQLLKASLDVQKTSVRNLELLYELGMASEVEVKQAQASLQQSESNLSSLELLLQAEKQSLNNLMGLDMNQNVIVQYDPEINPPEIPNVQSYATTKMLQAPNIWQLERAVEDAQYAYNTAEYTELDEIEMSNDLAAAKRNLADAKSKLEKAVYSTYNNLLTLEEQEKKILLDLEKAKDDYNTAIVNYAAGNITELQVQQAELGILQCEIELEKNKLNYASLLLAFENPYVLTLTNEQP